VWEILTPRAPLTVRGGETIRIENPLSEPIRSSSVSLARPHGGPTPEANWLRWPDAGWIEEYFNRSESPDEIVFAAPTEPGRYVVSAWIRYSPRSEDYPREAQYGLLLDVVD
jgi:hypothetical protein